MITEIESRRKADKSGRIVAPTDTRSRESLPGPSKHPVAESGFDVVLVTLSELLPSEAFLPENL